MKITVEYGHDSRSRVMAGQVRADCEGTVVLITSEPGAAGQYKVAVLRMENDVLAPYTKILSYSGAQIANMYPNEVEAELIVKAIWKEEVL